MTLKEVAEKAGVSIRTVSRVINGREDVAAETRQKVSAAAQELRYRPSLLARALVTRRSRTLGLVIPHLTNPYFAELAQGVFDAAHRCGYHVLMNNCNWSSEPELERESWQTLGDRAVEGLITDLLYGHEPQIIEYAQSFQPIVVLMKTIRHPGISTVGVDLGQGARAALEYLVRKGRRKIAMLVLKVPHIDAMERVTAYRKVMAENGLEEIIQYLQPGWALPDTPGGREAALQLLKRRPDVTAVFGYNDLIAIGALQACRQLGRRVPEDVAVIGHDDIPLAEIVQPGLTTVRLDKYQLGAQAVLRLLEMLDNPGVHFEPRMLPTYLALRESA